MADDPVVLTNTLPPIGFNSYTAEELKILHPNKTIEETSPPRVLPWSKNLGSLSEDQIRSSRERWVKSGNDPAAFDLAAEMDGHTVPDVETEKLERTHGLAKIDARDVKFENPLAAKHATELVSFIQAARFQGGLGGAIIDHIAENGPKIAQMSSAEIAAWTAKEEKLGITLAAGKVAWEKCKVDARAMLARLKDLPEASGGKFSRDLSQAALLNSAFLTLSLANQHQYWTSYAAAAARKAKAGKK